MAIRDGAAPSALASEGSFSKRRWPGMMRSARRRSPETSSSHAWREPRSLNVKPNGGTESSVSMIRPR